MSTKRVSFILLWIFLVQSVALPQNNSITENKIIIIEGPLQTQSGYATLRINPFYHKHFMPWIVKEDRQPIKNGYVLWEIPTTTPVAFINGLFSYNMAYLAEPGDSLHIIHNNNQVSFFGKGAEKFKLSKKVELFLNALKGSPEGLSDGDREPARSLQDYLAWNDYLNRKTNEWLTLLNAEKEHISELAYLDLKDRVLRHIEKIRMHKFHSIRRSTVEAPLNQFGLSNEDLCRIYDSTMDNASSRWLRYERDYIFPQDYPWDMLHDEDYRRRGKFFKISKSDTSILGQDPADQYVSIYNMIKEKYTGIARENLLAYTFYNPSGALREIGFTPKIEAILTDYYALPGYPEFKQRVKEYESERRKKWNMLYAPAFKLMDRNGLIFSSEKLKGKIAVMDFWFTGCSGCIQMTPVMRKVEEHFAKDSNIVFLSISIDKNKEQWAKSITQGKYTSGGGIQLYTCGEGDKHEVINKLLVESYPTLEIIDQQGLVIKYEKSKIDPRYDNGKSLTSLLQKLLSSMKDGPYVFHEEDQTIAYSIKRNELSKQYLNKTNKTPIYVITDGNNQFRVTLQSSLQISPAEYPRPEKLFALSDIEGNFDQLRKLLQANGVIDTNFNWTFGNGHLVFAGDMFDRGLQVTECLWLIYSLEEQAKASGGYVHFILGNHEIMNLQGQHDYVAQKYKNSAALLRKTVTQLYNEDSELGRWLRSKNIVEKIGDILFLHGGISRRINQLTLTIPEINLLARPYYSVNKTDYNYGEEKITSIMHPQTSPFWFRQYYDDKKDIPLIIDSTLQKFQVQHIITGHTIIADTISVHYGGKVINLDTHHAEGKSEALLIEKGRYYRIDDRGTRFFLFAEPKKESSFTKTQ